MRKLVGLFLLLMAASCSTNSAFIDSQSAFRPFPGFVPGELDMKVYVSRLDIENDTLFGDITLYDRSTLELLDTVCLHVGGEMYPQKLTNGVCIFELPFSETDTLIVNASFYRPLYFTSNT